MIDFHNHVLPDFDDGARTLEQSLNMLRTAVEQGITDVINTVHYQHPKVETKEITFERAKNQLAKLQAEVDDKGIDIKLHLGAEVFYLHNLISLRNNPLCTFPTGSNIGSRKYMLVEFPFHRLPQGYDEILFNLVMSGITPIIAHAERYKPIQQDIGILRKLIRSGSLIQIDAGSLIGKLGRSAQETSLDMVQQGLCHIIGSDAHDDRGRNFCLKEAVDICQRKVGNIVEEWVTTNPWKVLNGELIVADVEYFPEPSLTLWQKITHRFNPFVSN